MHKMYYHDRVIYIYILGKTSAEPFLEVLWLKTIRMNVGKGYDFLTVPNKKFVNGHFISPIGSMSGILTFGLNLW